MALSLSREGELLVLESIIKDNLTLRLFLNGTHPSKTMIFKDFIEVKGGGYKPQEMLRSDWDFKDINGRLAVVHPTVFFVFMSAVKDEIYGSYGTKTVDGKEKVIWAERFQDGPYIVLNRGDDVTVDPTIKLGG